MTNEERKLIDACSEGDTEVVKEMLAAGADVNCNDNWPMYVAIDKNHIDIVNILLADPNSESKAGGNPSLYHAVERGHMDILNILLNDPRTTKADVSSGLDSAISYGRLDMLDRLLSYQRSRGHGMEVNHLIWATYKNRIEMVKRLIHWGFKVTPDNLEYAKERNFPEILKLLEENM